MLVGVSETTGAVTDVPVPVSLTVCGVPVALSITSSVAVSAPVAMGFIATEIVQLLPAVRVVPQVVAVFTNDARLVPVMTIVVISSVALPVFLRVTT